MDESKLKEQLVKALGGSESHVSFEKTVKGFNPEMYGAKPGGSPHSAWELVEHMRIAQADILEFSRDPKHESPKFPEGYWPKTAAPPNEGAWTESVAAFLRDQQELADLIRKENLFKPFAHGDGQTLLREVILVANHNSYELGQLVLLKRMLAEKA